MSTEVKQQENPAALLDAPVSVCEQDSGWKVRVELPGVDRNSIKVQALEGLLTVEAVRVTADPGGYRPVVAEIPSGRFLTRLRLPAEADAQTLKAVSRDGVLEIEIRRVAKPGPVTVEVQGA